MNGPRFVSYSKQKPRKIGVAETRSKRHRTYFVIPDPLADVKSILEAKGEKVPKRMSSHSLAPSFLMPGSICMDDFKIQPLGAGDALSFIGYAVAVLKID